MCVCVFLFWMGAFHRICDPVGRWGVVQGSRALCVSHLHPAEEKKEKGLWPLRSFYFLFVSSAASMSIAREPVIVPHADAAAATASSCVALMCRACALAERRRQADAPVVRCPLCRGAVRADEVLLRPDPFASRVVDALPCVCALCGRNAPNADAMRHHHRLECAEWRVLAVLASHPHHCPRPPTCDCAGPRCRAGAILAERIGVAGNGERIRARVVEWLAERRRVRPGTCLEGLAEAGLLASADLFGMWVEAYLRAPGTLEETLHVMDDHTTVFFYCVWTKKMGKKWCAGTLGTARDWQPDGRLPANHLLWDTVSGALWGALSANLTEATDRQLLEGMPERVARSDVMVDGVLPHLCGALKRPGARVTAATAVVAVRLVELSAAPPHIDFIYLFFAFADGNFKIQDQKKIKRTADGRRPPGGAVPAPRGRVDAAAAGGLRPAGGHVARASGAVHPGAVRDGPERRGGRGRLHYGVAGTGGAAARAAASPGGESARGWLVVGVFLFFFFWFSFLFFFATATGAPVAFGRDRVHVQRRGGDAAGRLLLLRERRRRGPDGGAAAVAHGGAGAAARAGGPGGRAERPARDGDGHRADGAGVRRQVGAGAGPVRRQRLGGRRVVGGRGGGAVPVRAAGAGAAAPPAAAGAVSGADPGRRARHPPGGARGGAAAAGLAVDVAGVAVRRPPA